MPWLLDIRDAALRDGAGTAPPPSRRRLPSVIPVWMLWLQGLDDQSLHPYNRFCIEAWRALHRPDDGSRYDVRVLDATSLSEWLPDFDDVRARAPPTRTHQATSDMARLMLLERYGGVWVDASVLPVRSLDRWLTAALAEAKHGAVFFRYEPSSEGRVAASWFLAAATPHMYLFTRWRRCFESAFVGETGEWPYFRVNTCLTHLIDEDATAARDFMDSAHACATSAQVLYRPVDTHTQEHVLKRCLHVDFAVYCCVILGGRSLWCNEHASAVQHACGAPVMASVRSTGVRVHANSWAHFRKTFHCGYSEQHDVFVVVVPKNMSTAVEYAWLASVSPETQIEGLCYTGATITEWLSYVQRLDAEFARRLPARAMPNETIAHARGYVVTRHPFQRAVSAFCDIYLRGHNVVRAHGDDKRLAPRVASFMDFCLWLRERCRDGFRWTDQHFMPQSALLAPWFGCVRQVHAETGPLHETLAAVHDALSPGTDWAKIIGRLLHSGPRNGTAYGTLPGGGVHDVQTIGEIIPRAGFYDAEARAVIEEVYACDYNILGYARGTFGHEGLAACAGDVYTCNTGSLPPVLCAGAPEDAIVQARLACESWISTSVCTLISQKDVALMKLHMRRIRMTKRRHR